MVYNGNNLWKYSSTWTFNKENKNLAVESVRCYGIQYGSIGPKESFVKASICQGLVLESVFSRS